VPGDLEQPVARQTQLGRARSAAGLRTGNQRPEAGESWIPLIAVPSEVEHQPVLRPGPPG
jgi:hypothetical protein